MFIFPAIKDGIINVVRSKTSTVSDDIGMKFIKNVIYLINKAVKNMQ